MKKYIFVLLMALCLAGCQKTKEPLLKCDPQTDQIDESSLDKLLEISQTFIEEKRPNIAPTITDYDHPTINKVDEIPPYLATLEKKSNSDYFFVVTYYTNVDGLLGPETLYVDQFGVVVAEGIKE